MKKSKKKQCLSVVQKNELSKIISRMPNFSSQGSLGVFFDYYLVCEATARKLIYYKTGSDANILVITSIKAAVTLYFPEKEDQISIDDIFKSGEGHRHKKTCRQLRNSYIHNLSPEDRSEIETRITLLKSYMVNWINIITS